MKPIDITQRLLTAQRDSALIDRLAAALEGHSVVDQIQALGAMQGELVLELAGGDEEMTKQLWGCVVANQTAMLKKMMAPDDPRQMQ
ncbi:MAG: hypothetical protein R3F54_28870 [Alphaproteobacteria bacterium]